MWYRTLQALPDADSALGASIASPKTIQLTHDDFEEAWKLLDSGGTAKATGGATETPIQLVALGNPHFSLEECRRLASLVGDRTKSNDVSLVITMGREIYDQADSEGAG